MIGYLKIQLKVLWQKKIKLHIKLSFALAVFNFFAQKNCLALLLYFCPGPQNLTQLLWKLFTGAFSLRKQRVLRYQVLRLWAEERDWFCIVYSDKAVPYHLETGKEMEQREGGRKERHWSQKKLNPNKGLQTHGAIFLPALHFAEW